MKKSFILLCLIVFCGGSEQNTDKIITTSTLEETTTTTVKETTTTVQETTTTTIKKIYLIKSFNLKNVTQDSTKFTELGYLFAEVESDVIWDDFLIETTNQEGAVCEYRLNKKQIDNSRLLFIPELGCIPGIYTVSNILISYNGTDYNFDSNNNEISENNNVVCCNFVDVFNWKVEIKRAVSNKCKYGLVTDTGKCIVSAPLIKRLNLTEEGASDILIDYEFEFVEGDGFDKNNTSLLLQFDFKSQSNDFGQIGMYVINAPKSENTIQGNPWKDVILISKESEFVSNFNFNETYYLNQISIVFLSGNPITDGFNLVCVMNFDLSARFDLKDNYRGVPFIGNEAICSYDKYETVAYTNKTKLALPISPFEPTQFVSSHYFETNLQFDFEFQR